MKRTISTFLIICLFAANAGAQETKKDFVVKKGKSLVNVYYGPMLIRGVYRAVAALTATGIELKSVGPAGLVYEYMVTDEIGLGAELGYSKIILSFKDIQDDPITNQPTEYTYECRFTTTRYLLRFNYHMLKDEQLDVYGFASAGYKDTKIYIKTSSPRGGLGLKIPGFGSFGFKPGFGFRYYFNEALGMHAELAIGTPVICAGLSFRL